MKPWSFAKQCTTLLSSTIWLHSCQSLSSPKQKQCNISLSKPVVEHCWLAKDAVRSTSVQTWHSWRKGKNQVSMRLSATIVSLKTSLWEAMPRSQCSVSPMKVPSKDGKLSISPLCMVLPNPSTWKCLPWKVANSCFHSANEWKDPPLSEVDSTRGYFWP